MGHITIELDDELVEECQKATGIKSLSALIEYAMRELLRPHRQKKILELKGAIEWHGDLETWRESRESS